MVATMVATMVDDANNPEILTHCANALMAKAIVVALADQGIQATTTGDYTAGFLAEAPGTSQVVVKRKDLPRAQQVLAEINADTTEIDWSQVDVGEPEDD